MPGVVVAESEVVVRCGGVDHVIRWSAGGGLQLLGHPGPRDADDVLVALSGEAAACRAIEDAWTRLGVEHARALLDATPDRLAWMAHRLPATREQRERVRRRDDLSDDQRAALLANFDQLIAAAEVAGLGSALAHARAAEVLAGRWRWRRRRSRRRAELPRHALSVARTAVLRSESR